ncbi:MAG: succinyl-diaminopimelate desuccinylase [Burkholderiales bacterium]|jgi:succinyl-diaminopimelate desuccinylase|nr:succinyl-diaminopimelate desuccinylase [Burkholderiales bacterium]
MSTRHSPVVSLTGTLIRKASMTPKDAGCQKLIADRLSTLGFSCEWFNKNGVTNLWARRGISSPLVCFAGHTDVVPPGPVEKWQFDPFTPTLKDGVLYGRGAVDMKGGIAAFMVAIDRFVKAHAQYHGSLAVLLTSDEEGVAVDGTAHVVETLAARGEKIDYCIIAEPSSSKTLGDTIKVGRRGSLSGKLTIQGVQGHIAYPQKAKNPIHLLAPVLTELITTDWDAGRRSKQFPPTQFQCSNVHAGTGATNVIPGEIALDFNFRYSPENTESSLKNRIEVVLMEFQLDYRLDWLPASRPFLTQKGNLVSFANTVLREVTGSSAVSSCDGGTSDGRFIVDICPQLIELGLINQTAHQVDEHVAVADLEALSDIFERLIGRLILA